ncbi:MAG: uridine kinase [Bryobacteraceae bacterium]|nr:uridine kinase [Bryobacteraceae bacterium]
MPPYLIAIAGPSGAGKSYLAHHLAAALPAEAAVLSLDSYYRELTSLSYDERCLFNFDHPSSLDQPLLLQQLRDVAAGKTIERPIYQFETHSRAPHTERFAPPPFVILEGIFALYFPEIRDLAQLKVFVETPDGLCFDRRLRRDTTERERTAESVTRQYDETVRPMAAEYVWPTAAFADLVIPGNQPIAESLRQVLAAMPQMATAAGKD